MTEVMTDIVHHLATPSEVSKVTNTPSLPLIHILFLNRPSRASPWVLPHPRCERSRGLYLAKSTRLSGHPYLRSFSIKSMCVSTIRRQQYRVSPSLSRASLKSQQPHRKGVSPFRKFLHIQEILFPFISNDLYHTLVHQNILFRGISHLSTRETTNGDNHRGFEVFLFQSKLIEPFEIFWKVKN